MRKPLVTLGLVVALLGALATAYVAIGLRLFGRYQVVYADYKTSCDALITWDPPATIYTGIYPNEPTFVTLRYRSPTPASLNISVSIPQLTEEQSYQVNATPAFQQLTFKPALLTVASLDTLTGPDQRDAQVRLRVTHDGLRLCDTSLPVVVKSAEWMRWTDASGADNTPYIAGWVTPDAPAIQTLVGASAQWAQQHPASYPGLTRLVGYDQGVASPTEVRQQVDALFDTLQFVYHLRYASDNIPASGEQRIQLPQQVLAQSAPAGMCVETTDTLASAVERLGMRPFIVIVPGHAFLGVALGAAPTAPVEYWETSDLNDGVTGSQANLHGTQEYQDHLRQRSITSVVDVEAERQQGIEPND